MRYVDSVFPAILNAVKYCRYSKISLQLVINSLGSLKTHGSDRNEQDPPCPDYSEVPPHVRVAEAQSSKVCVAFDFGADGAWYTGTRRISPIIAWPERYQVVVHTGKCPVVKFIAHQCLQRVSWSGKPYNPHQFAVNGIGLVARLTERIDQVNPHEPRVH